MSDKPHVNTQGAALQELADLMDDISQNGTYKPDSFTTQPARAAITKATGQ